MARRRSLPLVVVGLVFLALVAGCARRPSARVVDVTEEAGGGVGFDASSPGYGLRVGDKLELLFLSAPRYNYETVVTPGGTVTVPMGSEVVALGRTVGELSAEIADAMSPYLLDPTTSVVLRALGEQPVFVVGEVGGPSRVLSSSELTVSMALATTGGIKPTGKAHSVMVVRTYGVPEPVAIRVDISKVLSGEDLSQDIRLLPNDVVYVPKTLIGKIDDFVDLFFQQIAPAQIFYLRGYDMVNLKGAEWRW